MANFKNKSDKYEILTTIVFNEDFKKRCPIAYNLKVEEMMEENGLTREEAEQTLLGSEVEMELYYEKGRGFFAVESDAVECTNIYSPYTKEEFVDIDELDEDIALFLSQAWYNEWEKESDRYNSEDALTFLRRCKNNLQSNIFVGGAFNWDKTDKGLFYWSEKNREWQELLNNKEKK